MVSVRAAGFGRADEYLKTYDVEANSMVNKLRVFCEDTVEGEEILEEVRQSALAEPLGIETQFESRSTIRDFLEEFALVERVANVVRDVT